LRFLTVPTESAGDMCWMPVQYTVLQTFAYLCCSKV